MKSKRIYIFLIVSVIILITVAAILTHMLMSMTVPEAKNISIDRKSGVGKEEITAASETTIKLDEPNKKPITNETTWRSDRLTKEQQQFKPPSPTDQPGIGTISSLRGSAQLVTSDDKKNALDTDKRINIGDKILTGPNSNIQITFDDGTIISQGENSTIVIDEFLYSPHKPKDNHFTLRIIKGICRSVSGMITNLNPDSYKVKTRMATIGIRGCDLIFHSTRLKEDIFVLDLAGKKEVVIETTTNGSPVRDPAKDTDLPIDNSIRKVITIEKPNQMVTLKRRTPPEKVNAPINTVRKMIGMSSIARPAKYELTPGPDGMVIDIKTPLDN